MEYILQSVTLLLFPAPIALSKDVLHSQHLKSCRIVFLWSPRKCSTASLISAVLFGIILFSFIPSLLLHLLLTQRKEEYQSG